MSLIVITDESMSDGLANFYSCLIVAGVLNHDNNLPVLQSWSSKR